MPRQAKMCIFTNECVCVCVCVCLCVCLFIAADGGSTDGGGKGESFDSLCMNPIVPILLFLMLLKEISCA